jgi:peptide/nickel transport system substrate-binding protein
VSATGTIGLVGGIRIMLPIVVLALLTPACGPSLPAQNLRMAYPHELVSLDPHAHADAVTRSVLAAMFECLVSFEPGRPINAALADRWTTPDELTWQIHVREGVQFHDGSRLMPADVVASIERARGIGLLGHQLDEIEKASVLDEEERLIEIRTAKPAPLLLTQLASVAIVPENFHPSIPVGTGPYQWQVGSVQGPIVLQRWNGYWQETPEFDQISIQFVSVLEELVELLEHQMLDVVTAVSKDYVMSHNPQPPWRVVSLPAVATTYLGINVRHAPLDDIRVRRAIDRVIDRQRLVSKLYPAGMAAPATSLVPPEVFGFSPDHRSDGPNPEQAGRLLAEAGVEPGTKLRLDYQDRYAFMIPALVEVLAEVELDVEPQRHAYETYYRRIEEAENELFLFSWNFQIADAAPFLEAIVHSRDPRGFWGSFNGAAVSDPDLDLLIEQAAHETRSEMRLEMLQKLLADVSAAHVYLPLSQPAVLVLAREPFDVVGRKLRPQDVRINR